jgi:hypothetical protein
MNREKLNAVFIEHRTQYSADCAFLRDDDHAIRLISPSIATILLCCSFENVHRIIPRGLNFNLPRLVSSQPGGRKGVSRSTFSTYTVVPELWSVDKIDGFWAQISCSTYDAMIPFGVDVSITFLCLAFYRWRLRLSYEKHGYFEVKLGDLNRVTRSRTQPWTQPGYATKRGRYRQNVHKP